jgi:hypothetical protein
VQRAERLHRERVDADVIVALEPRIDREIHRACHDLRKQTRPQRLEPTFAEDAGEQRVLELPLVRRSLAQALIRPDDAPLASHLIPSPLEPSAHQGGDGPHDGQPTRPASVARANGLRRRAAVALSRGDRPAG